MPLQFQSRCCRDLRSFGRNDLHPFCKTGGGGNALEDSIKAMLKPMIRDWLDDNMPRILEGAIKEEVKELWQR